MVSLPAAFIFFPFPFYRFTHTLFAKSRRFCQIVSIYSQLPRYQRYQKSSKREAHQPLRCPPLHSKSLDFKPFLYTFAKSSKIPMASILNSRLCGIYPSVIHLSLLIYPASSEWLYSYKAFIFSSFLWTSLPLLL